MQYVLRVCLYGGLSREYFRPLSNITLCVHQNCAGKTTNPESLSRIVEYIDHGGILSVRKNIFFAEGTTDAKGKTDMQLNSCYTGGPFDVSIKPENQDSEKSKLIQLATLKPSWYRNGDGYIYFWNYYLFPRSAHRIEVPDSLDHGSKVSSPSAGKRIRTSVPTSGVE